MTQRFLAAALAVSVLLSTGAAVSADQGGTPDGKSCHGQTVSRLASTGNTPATSGRNPGEYNQSIKDQCDYFAP
jgi:hypothetical protein